jgi:hypothetical protein
MPNQVLPNAQKEMQNVDSSQKHDHILTKLGICPSIWDISVLVHNVVIFYLESMNMFTSLKHVIFIFHFITKIIFFFISDSPSTASSVLVLRVLHSMRLPASHPVAIAIAVMWHAPAYRGLQCRHAPALCKSGSSGGLYHPPEGLYQPQWGRYGPGRLRL